MLNSTIPFGAVAQLGERLHGMQEVVSSNLIGSTIKNSLFGLRGPLTIHFGGQANLFDSGQRQTEAALTTPGQPYYLHVIL